MKQYRTLTLILGSALSLALLTLSPNLLAESKSTQYRLVYADNSPMKDLSLNNVDFKVHYYLNGMPKGQRAFKSNEEGQFEFNQAKHGYHQRVAMNLVKLQDDAKNKETCEGQLVQGKNELKVTCYKKKVSASRKNKF
jgi:hypothetical protein